jgi:hypothetical protein
VSFAIGVALCALVAGIVFSPLARPDPWTQWEKMTTFPTFGAEMKQKLFLIDANGAPDAKSFSPTKWSWP